VSLRDRAVHYRVEEGITGEQAAARLSAYIYGNIIIFAALVPLGEDDVKHGHGVQLILGVAVSTYLAHVFAEIIGHAARAGESMTRAEIVHELKDSRPVASSGVLPALLLGAASAHWMSASVALLISEIYLLVRLALVGFMIERFRAERASFRTLIGGLALAAVAAGISLLKVLLGH
jgi:hypothetical protein